MIGFEYHFQIPQGTEIVAFVEGFKVRGTLAQNSFIGIGTFGYVETKVNPSDFSASLQQLDQIDARQLSEQKIDSTESSPVVEQIPSVPDLSPKA